MIISRAGSFIRLSFHEIADIKELARIIACCKASGRSAEARVLAMRIEEWLLNEEARKKTIPTGKE